MSQTIFQKLDLLFNATLHDIVNKALQRNPIQVLTEYLRQHEEAFDQLHSDLAVTGGAVKTAVREVEGYKVLIARLTVEIERVYTDSDPTNDYVADNLGLELVGKEDLLVSANSKHQTALRAHNALLTGRTKLHGRIISLKNQIDLLRAVQSEADIKGMTADILIKSARMISSGVTSVEGLTETIMQNRDKADAKFEMALERFQTDDVETAVQGRASDRLAQIRARIGVNDERAEVADTSLDMSAGELEVLKAQ